MSEEEKEALTPHKVCFLDRERTCKDSCMASIDGNDGCLVLWSSRRLVETLQHIALSGPSGVYR